MRSPRVDWIAAALLLVLTSQTVRAEGFFYRIDAEGNAVEDTLRIAEDVSDPFFSVMVGVLDREQFGRLDTAYFDSVATAAGGSRVPLERIVAMEKTPAAAPATSRIKVQLDGPMKVPIPYAILSYNPGSVRASERFEMVHWVIGDQTIRYREDDEDRELEAQDVHLFGLIHGEMSLDIDGWLDRLMRGKLDDVNLVGYAIFRDGDRRIGLGVGYNNKEKGRTGALDLARNESLFPAPKSYLALGRGLREIAEARMEAIRASETTIAPTTVD
jgi:hypothetical protein